MAGCLEGITNPLPALNILTTEMKWRGNWSATTQYYQNDVVRSPTNGIEYILGTLTALRGGLDPGDLANTTGNWTALGGIASSSQNPAFADAGGGVYTITGGNLLGVPAFSRWLISFQGDRDNLVPQTNLDVDTITFTAPGGDTLVVDILPNLNNPANTLTSFAFMGVVQAGLAAGDIVMTGTYTAGQAAADYVGDKVSYIRLS
jgi:hypothetical protein